MSEAEIRARVRVVRRGAPGGGPGAGPRRLPPVRALRRLGARSHPGGPDRGTDRPGRAAPRQPAPRTRAGAPAHALRQPAHRQARRGARRAAHPARRRNRRDPRGPERPSAGGRLRSLLRKARGHDTRARALPAQDRRRRRAGVRLARRRRTLSAGARPPDPRRGVPLGGRRPRRGGAARDRALHGSHRRGDPRRSPRPGSGCTTGGGRGRRDGGEAARHRAQLDRRRRHVAAVRAGASPRAVRKARLARARAPRAGVDLPRRGQRRRGPRALVVRGRRPWPRGAAASTRSWLLPNSYRAALLAAASGRRPPHRLRDRGTRVASDRRPAAAARGPAPAARLRRAARHTASRPISSRRVFPCPSEPLGRARTALGAAGLAEDGSSSRSVPGARSRRPSAGPPSASPRWRMRSPRGEIAPPSSSARAKRTSAVRIAAARSIAARRSSAPGSTRSSSRPRSPSRASRSRTTRGRCTSPARSERPSSPSSVRPIRAGPVRRGRLRASSTATSSARRASRRSARTGTSA